MNKQDRIRELREDDIADAYSLVTAVFDEFVAPLFSEEGIAGFKSFIEPHNWKDWLRAQHLILIGEVGSSVVGIVALRDWNHIFLLFVDRDFQRMGIAKQLVTEAIARCVDAGHHPDRITVNSSPNAAEAYQAMGFEPTSDEREEHGMQIVPMALDLSEVNQTGT